MPCWLYPLLPCHKQIAKLQQGTSKALQAVSVVKEGMQVGLMDDQDLGDFVNEAE